MKRKKRKCIHEWVLVSSNKPSLTPVVIHKCKLCGMMIGGIDTFDNNDKVK